MPTNGSNRALRMLVAELAELGDRDLEAILADLDPGERNQLLKLMAEHRDGERRPGEGQDSGLALSQWLGDRLEGAVSPAMTPAAAEALRQLAADLGWRRTASAPAVDDPLQGLRAWLGRRP